MLLALSSLDVVIRATRNSASPSPKNASDRSSKCVCVCPNTPCMPSKRNAAFDTHKMRDILRSVQSRHMRKHYTRHVQTLSRIPTQITRKNMFFKTPAQRTNTHGTTLFIHVWLCQYCTKKTPAQFETSRKCAATSIVQYFRKRIHCDVFL